MPSFKKCYYILLLFTVYTYNVFQPNVRSLGVWVVQVCWFLTTSLTPLTWVHVLIPSQPNVRGLGVWVVQVCWFLTTSLTPLTWVHVLIPSQPIVRGLGVWVVQVCWFLTTSLTPLTWVHVLIPRFPDTFPLEERVHQSETFQKFII